MKNRTGFVSNSSSSSFILVNPTKADLDLIFFETDNDALQVYGKTKDNICKHSMEKYGKDLAVKSEDKIYITSFISDGYDFSISDLSCDYEEYFDGGHGRPYSEEGFIKCEGIFGSKPVYILEEDFDSGI